MTDHLNEYLVQLLQPDDDWVKRLKKNAKKDNVPIMEQMSINLLMQLIRLYRPMKVLEIGTGIGYSALQMLEAHPEMKIISIERDKQRYEQAIENIQDRNKQDNINVMHGDALQVLKSLEEKKDKFDFVFIDAAKRKYEEFFRLSIPLLTKNSVVITDNVLFRGYVAQSKEEYGRYKNIVEDIRQFNKWLMSHPEFNSVIIPIGDGIAVSIRERHDEK